MRRRRRRRAHPPQQVVAAWQNGFRFRNARLRLAFWSLCGGGRDQRDADREGGKKAVGNIQGRLPLLRTVTPTGEYSFPPSPSPGGVRTNRAASGRPSQRRRVSVQRCSSPTAYNLGIGTNQVGGKVSQLHVKSLHDMVATVLASSDRRLTTRERQHDLQKTIWELRYMASDHPILQRSLPVIPPCLLETCWS